MYLNFSLHIMSPNLKGKNILMQTCHKENYVQSSQNEYHRFEDNNDKFLLKKQTTEHKKFNSKLMAFAKFEWI